MTMPLQQQLQASIPSVDVMETVEGLMNVHSGLWVRLPAVAETCNRMRRYMDMRVLSWTGRGHTSWNA